jgi:hypothetical protein
MHRTAVFDQQCLVLSRSARIFFILLLLLVAVSSDSEYNHLRAPRTRSHLTRRLQDEATEDLTWLLTESNLTTGTILYKDTNYHVTISKNGSTLRWVRPITLTRKGW